MSCWYDIGGGVGKLVIINKKGRQRRGEEGGRGGVGFVWGLLRFVLGWGWGWGDWDGGNYWWDGGNGLSKYFDTSCPVFVSYLNPFHNLLNLI